jgi:AcrR family transcriptional regulator
MAKADTKNTILDAAEDLFAEQGFGATSLRQLTARAGVNLAAVNYHFGSKEDLAKAVLRRRIEPINRERRERLDDMRDPASVEDIVRAFIEPALRPQASEAGSATESRAAGLCRVFGRISVEQPPFLREFFREQFSELGQRFISMLSEAAPGTPAEALWWRMHFTVGAMAHTLQSAHIVGEISGGVCDPNDHVAIIEHLTAYAIGGFSATRLAQ